VAVTVKLYAVPFVRPVIVQPLVDPLTEQLPAGLPATAYLLIGLPPFEAGAVHASVTRPSPGVAVRPVGAPGTVAGVALAGADAGPVPTALVAVTVKV
jgi:hypothetical protein